MYLLWLVPAYPGCPGSKAVKRSLLLLLLLWLTIAGLEAWVTLQKSKTAVKAMLHDITVSDHQPNAIFPKVGSHLLLPIDCLISAQ